MPSFDTYGAQKENRLSQLLLPKHKNTSNHRPRLANLTAQKKEKEEENRAINIQLPVERSKHIQKEITIMILTAIILNLVYAPTWQTVFWVIGLLFWFDWSNRWVITYSQYICIFMALFTHDDAWLYKLVPLTSCFLFNTAERIFNASQLELEHQAQQHQLTVNKAINDYSHRRDMFVSITSRDIGDASAMITATLEQFAPPSILSNTYELLSACSMAVPITTISAINTTVKQACHIGSQLKVLSDMLSEHVKPKKTIETTAHHSFNIGELVQNVGDALAGLSAKLGIHFIIYHMDNGLHYTNIIGDEDATRHALVHVRLIKNFKEGS